MLTENINMQMEAEYADLIDRNLMALYGGKTQEHGTKGKRPQFKLDRTQQDVEEIERSTQMTFRRQGRVPTLGTEPDEEDAAIAAEKSLLDSNLYMRDIYASDKSRKDLNELITTGINCDDIRSTSGRIMPDPVQGMPISLDQKCLSHQT